eukprot:397134-Amorphochlora_amoeboformis.AAC.1
MSRRIKRWDGTYTHTEKERNQFSFSRLSLTTCLPQPLLNRYPAVTQPFLDLVLIPLLPFTGRAFSPRGLRIAFPFFQSVGTGVGIGIGLGVCVGVRSRVGVGVGVGVRAGSGVGTGVGLCPWVNVWGGVGPGVRLCFWEGRDCMLERES